MHVWVHRFGVYSKTLRNMGSIFIYLLIQQHHFFPFESHFVFSASCVRPSPPLLRSPQRNDRLQTFIQSIQFLPLHSSSKYAPFTASPTLTHTIFVVKNAFLRWALFISRNINMMNASWKWKYFWNSTRQPSNGSIRSYPGISPHNIAIYRVENIFNAWTVAMAIAIRLNGNGWGRFIISERRSFFFLMLCPGEAHGCGILSNASYKYYLC